MKAITVIGVWVLVGTYFGIHDKTARFLGIAATLVLLGLHF